MKARKLLKILFIFIYILGLLNILFLRNHMHRFWPNLSFIEYFKYSSNFIPLKTIIGYVSGCFNGKFALLIVVKNILGNFVLFIPMGFIAYDYLQQHDIKKWIYFLFLTCFFLLLEIIQAVFRVGFFDIDDIILYLTGFAIGMQLKKILKKLKK